MAYAVVYDANGLMVNGGEGAELLGEDGRRYVHFSGGRAHLRNAHPRLWRPSKKRPEAWDDRSRLREPHSEALLGTRQLVGRGKAFCAQRRRAIEAASSL
jgi:hypothetical protein